MQDVRRTLYETISSFDDNIRCGVKMEAVIARKFTALKEVFHASTNTYYYQHRLRLVILLSAQSIQ